MCHRRFDGRVPSSHSVGGELVSLEDGSGLDVDVCERSTGLFASVDRGDDRGRVRALCPDGDRYPAHVATGALSVVTTTVLTTASRSKSD